MAEPQIDRYIVLPSNVKHIEGDKINRPNHFKTPLDRPLELPKRDWEVALAEINYPHSWSKSINTSYLWYHVRKINYVWVPDKFIPTETNADFNGKLFSYDFAYWSDDDSIVVRSKDPSRHKDLFTPGEIIKFLNDIRPDILKGSFNFTKYDPKRTQKRVSIVLREGESIFFSPSLQTLLGFDDPWVSRYSNSERIELLNPESAISPQDTPSKDKNPSNQRFKIIAPKRADFNESKYNIFVYCNLVENTIVGDTQVPLLRSIAVDEDNQNKYVSQHFQDLRYIPLSSNFFQYIEIKITDDYGELINFEYGKVVVTLHLRRRQR